MNIELEYILEADDLAELTMAYQEIARKIIPRHRYWAARLIPWIAAVLVGIGVAITFHIAPNPSPDARDRAPNAVLAVFPWLLIGVCVFFFLFRKRLRELIFRQHARRRMAHSPNTAQPQRVNISDDAVIIQSPTAHSTLAWAHFLHFAETEHLFVLFASPRLTFILPKRAFPAPAAIDEFRAFAQAHIGNTPIGFPVQPPKSPDATPSPPRQQG